MPSAPGALEEIGAALLMANDLVLPNRPGRSDSTLEKLANLLPFTDYIPHDEYINDIARSLLMFEEVAVAPAVKEAAEYMDLPELFLEHLGIGLREFCELVFAAATRYLVPKTNELLSSPEALLLRPAFFRNTRIPPEKVRTFLSKVALAADRYREELKRLQERPGDDFSVLQRFSFLEVLQDVFICLDPGFLVEKAGRGLYWTLFSELPTNREREKLAAFWGRLFEEYINEILESNYSVGGRLMKQPRFSNGDQAFDACLLEGRNLVVLEHKASVLRADCKYSGDAARLGDELRLKFIEGHTEGKKGLGQLKHNLVRFFGGDPLDGLAAESVDRVYPALVCLDRSMGVPFMGRYLDEEFRKDFPPRKTRQVITPLIALTVNDVESFAPYLHTVELCQIFESFHAKNKARLWSMSSSEVPVLKPAKKGKDIIREKFSEFARTMEVNLFGDQAESVEQTSP